MTVDVTLFRWDELALDKVTEMVSRKTVSGADLTLTQAYFKKGAIVPLHRHDGERLIYVLQGALRTQVGAADATHQAESLDDTFVLTVARVPAPV